MTEVKQDPGEVFSALAMAFGAMAPEAQSEAITTIYATLDKLLEERLDTAGIEAEQAADHDVLRPLMLAVNMVRAMFGSRGRVRVLRSGEAALITSAMPNAPASVQVIEAVEGETANALVKRLAALAHTPSTPVPPS